MVSGRPPKAGIGDVAKPVNVRMNLEDYGVLADLAAEIRIPGCPPPNVQDILRSLVRGAIREPATLRRLIALGQGHIPG